MFQLDDESEERIELVCRLDLIGRAIAEAVTQNMAGTVTSAFRPDQTDSDCPAA